MNKAVSSVFPVDAGLFLCGRGSGMPTAVRKVLAIGHEDFARLAATIADTSPGNRPAAAAAMAKVWTAARAV